MNRIAFSEPEVPDLKENLILAYRKAKADVYYQSANRFKLLKYESKLESNLQELEEAILFGHKAVLFKQREFTGTGTFAPKSLRLNTDSEGQSTASDNENIVFASPLDQWDQAVNASENGPKPYSSTFRLMSDCGIGLHVLSALWIMLIGSKIEQSLFRKTPYANRIRRTRDGEYNPSSLGSFERYLDGYQTWISDATNAMDNLVNEGKKVASFSTDAKEYFHSIPANILDMKAFEKYRQFGERSDFEVKLTNCLSESLKNWEKNTAKHLDLISGMAGTPNLGLPVGLSCSALIGNVILDGFDKAVIEEVKPVFYGRYVDDITIIMEWHEDFTSSTKVWNWMSQRIFGLNTGSFQSEQGSNEVTYKVFPMNENVGESIAESEELSIVFKTDKTRLLVANQSAGKRTIDALKSALQKNSSEWRMLTRVPVEAENIGPELITALDESGEPAIRSSQLKILTSTRSTLSLWLRDFEQLERLCDPGTWGDHRAEFYRVIEEQLLNPLSIMDFSAFIHRALALALNCGDLDDFIRLVKTSFDAARRIEESSIPKISPERLETNRNPYGLWRQSLRKSIRELIFATSPTTTSSFQRAILLRHINAAFNCSPPSSSSPQPKEVTSIENIFYALFNHDLALIPFKEVLSPVEVSTVDFTNWKSESGKPGITNNLETSNFERVLDLTHVFPVLKGALAKPFWKTILTRSHLNHAPVDRKELFPAVVFPTRPLSITQAISWSEYLTPRGKSGNLSAPEVRADFDELEEWAVFLRGFSIRNAILSTQSYSVEPQNSTHNSEQSKPNLEFGISPDDNTLRIPRIDSVINRNPKIAVTSVFTDSKQITRSIAGKTSLDFKSYRALCRFVEHLVSSTPESSKPDYILFPELAMPAPWFEWFGNHLATKHHIGLISGITYLQGQDPNVVHNQIWASLPTPIVGFQIAAIYRQDKQMPAHGEEQNLRNFSPSKVLEPKTRWDTPPVIQHGDFSFALLICSELTNIANRASLRGKIDVLFVAEKNRDLTTFEALVDSAALDIHAYIAQSNSREFGDSRIRAPRKESHEREVARVRGGINDYFVVGEIKVKELREFQSWHFKGSGFKPLPDGFRADFDHVREWIPPTKSQ